MFVLLHVHILDDFTVWARLATMKSCFRISAFPVDSMLLISLEEEDECSRKGRYLMKWWIANRSK